MLLINANVDAFVGNRGITKDALAKAIGISRSSFYDKLSGKRPWMLTEIIKLASYMNLSVDELLNVPLDSQS